MTNLELVLNMLAEATTKEISKKKKSVGMEANKTVARQGGHVAGTARREIESKTGERVVSCKNAEQLFARKTEEVEIGGVKLGFDPRLYICL